MFAASGDDHGELNNPFFVKNNFWRTHALFAEPLRRLFWTSGDVCPGFQSQGGSLDCMLSRLRAMDSSTILWISLEICCGLRDILKYYNFRRQLIEKHYPWLLETYDSYAIEMSRINVAKYMILYHHGGMYLDVDMECKVSYICIKKAGFPLKFEWKISMLLTSQEIWSSYLYSRCHLTIFWRTWHLKLVLYLELLFLPELVQLG